MGTTSRVTGRIDSGLLGGSIKCKYPCAQQAFNQLSPLDLWINKALGHPRQEGEGMNSEKRQARKMSGELVGL